MEISRKQRSIKQVALHNSNGGVGLLLWRIRSNSASTSFQLRSPHAPASASVSLIALLFAWDDCFFVTGVSMAMGVLSRLSIRGLLVASTSSAIRTSSGMLEISIGVGCDMLGRL